MRRLLAPVTHGIATDRENRNARIEPKAIARAVCVIHNMMTAQLSDELRHIKSPAHHKNTIRVHASLN